MKKVISILLITIVIGLTFAGCGGKSSWKVEDFSFYNSAGKEVQFATADESISLREELEDTGKQLMTKKGIQIGDRAATALKKYDLDGFYFNITHIGSRKGDGDKEEAARLDKRFHKEYKTFEKAVQHADELSGKGLVLFGSMIFYVDGKRITPCKLNENGHIEDEQPDKDIYEVFFYIEDEKITDIEVEKRKTLPKELFEDWSGTESKANSASGEQEYKEATYYEIVSHPEKYAGQRVKLYGRVDAAELVEGQYNVLINLTEYPDVQKHHVGTAYIPGAGLELLQKGDWVTVYGEMTTDLVEDVKAEKVPYLNLKYFTIR